MDMENVTLKMPVPMLRQARGMATARDVSLGHLVRELLKKEINRQLSAKTSNRTDERLVAALQALLARDIAEASGWADLSQRLARHGYGLAPSGGGLILIRSPCGSRVCKASELGFAYRTLVKRFQAALPGHPHGTLGLLFPEDEDDAVIEPF